MTLEGKAAAAPIQDPGTRVNVFQDNHMGKQIRIYLADGTATGIRHAEITNWSGQALACPRSRFLELKNWEEIQRPGVYFLFGTDDETGEDRVYIGESEVVLDRLSVHLTGKEFWSELVAFTSKDDNLTKGHVKYLESQLIRLASSANRYRVTNTASPQLPALPRADRDAMEEYLLSARALLGVLGHRVLEPYVQPQHSADATNCAMPVPANSAESRGLDSQSGATVPVVFELRNGGISATAERTDEGLVVLAGSEAHADARGSLSGGYRTLRDKLLSTGVLEHVNGKLRFTKDQLFTSPSQAAAVLVGYAINGRDAWRLPGGVVTYGAYEQKVTDDLLKQLAQGN